MSDNEVSGPDELIRDHLWLVNLVARSIAKRLPPQVELSDIISAGTLGLVEAAQRFDASRGIKFPTFAERRIRGAILDHLRSLDYVPRSVRKKGRDMQQAKETLTSELGREPTRDELLTHLGVNIEDAGDFSAWNPPSLLELDAMIADNSNTSFSAFIVGDDGSKSLFGNETTVRHLAGQVMGALPERERRIFELYYFQGNTMEEVGQIMGISESRISQLHTRAVLIARESINGNRVLIVPSPQLVLKKEKPTMQGDIGVLGLTEATASYLATKGIVNLGNLRTMPASQLRILGLHPKAAKSVVQRMVEHSVWFADGEKATRQLLEKGAFAAPKDEPKPIMPEKTTTTIALTPSVPNGNSALVQLTAASMAGAISEFLRTGDAAVESIQTTVILSAGGKKFRLNMELAPKED